ncbi:MAG: leucine-rich repeat domain-containing protein [Lachnospiraceae bacterium]|nr:leucine-rich repeat domain-containing protein [Lachnospiraceae bacterium]
MKKHIVGIIAAAVFLAAAVILFLIPSVSISAKDESEFTVENGILRRYNGNDEVCVIPEDVVQIGPGAFSGSKLTQVTIPANIKVVGTQAFYDCKKLSRVIIMDGVQTLGMSCFANCPALNMVDIPASVTKIMPGAFAGDTGLSSLALSPQNEKYFFNDGVLYNSKSTELVQYLAGRKSTYFYIPFTVEKIDRYAFWGATLLTDVRISNNVNQIPDHAFSNCVGLTSIYLPESVRRIGAYGFSDCVNLYFVGMERSDVDIAPTAFSGCSPNLTAKGGVDEENVKTERQKAENKAISVSSDRVKKTDSSSSGKKKKKEEDKEDKNTTGKVKRDKEGYYAFPSLPGSSSSKGIEEDENLIGYTKVSGGNALVLPKKNK